MTLFDTHVHFSEKDPEAFYERSKAAGVDFLLIVGANVASSFEARNFAEQISKAWFSPGIHPHDAGKEDFSLLHELISHRKSVAIGETGLDYYYEFSERIKQKNLFEKSLSAALERKLPAVVHCRDKDPSGQAYSDCFEYLNDFSSAGGRFVMHCFTGDNSWLEKFLSIGAYISFGGIITFGKGENVRELLRRTPLERILFETDAPYLAPNPLRGKPNHPEYLPITVKKAAEVLSCELEVLAEKTVDNSFELFSKAERK
ncbi:MAG TPA: TatD family hydrolase [Victivallales bacterium]|nr:TatD family hydrolase [Victivallales bacterium]